MTKRIALLGVVAFFASIFGLQAQNYALGTNIPSLLTGTINLEPSVALSKSVSLQLSFSARPALFKLQMPVGIVESIYGMRERSLSFNNRMRWGSVAHTELVSLAPALRYWFRGTYNRGLFLSMHALGMLYRYGGDIYSPYYSEGFLVGAGASVGYSYELAPHWNLEAEAGLAGVWTRYDLRASATKVVGRDRSRFLALPSRVGVRLVYLF
mgnify:FL=1